MLLEMQNLVQKSKQHLLKYGDFGQLPSLIEKMKLISFCSRVCSSPASICFVLSAGEADGIFMHSDFFVQIVLLYR